MRTRRATLRSVTVATVLALAVLLPVSAALASCAGDERSLEQQIDEAEVVFVGTVVGVRDQRRTASFEVHDVWKGPDLDGQVVVWGGHPPGPMPSAGPGEGRVGSSVDRSWHMGHRYLVMPRIEDGWLADNICTPTRVWEDRFAAARPADDVPADDVRQPDAEVTVADEAVATATSTPWIIVGVTVLAVGTATAFVAARRR